MIFTNICNSWHCEAKTLKDKLKKAYKSYCVFAAENLPEQSDNLL